MSSCEICPILKTRDDGRDIVVFETEYWRGVLDPDQRSLGKMFITLLTSGRASQDVMVRLEIDG